MRARNARIGLIAAALLLAVVGLVLANRLGRDRVPGHAYAIPSGDDRIIVEVLNGTRRQGLARTATRLLRRQGIDVVFFGSTDSTDSTRVIVRRGARSRADQVARALGVGKVVTESDTLRRVDVTVILGRDYAPEGGIHP